MKRSIGLMVVLGALTMTAGCELLGMGGGGEAGGGESGGGGMDPTQFVKAPGKVPVSGNMAEGWMISQDMTAGGQTNPTSYAIVGDAGDSWQMEHTNPGLTSMAASMPELKDMVIGLTVNKEDGMVTKAVLGKKGEAGMDIEILAVTEAQPTEMPEGVEEDVTIGLGTFPAIKTATEHMTSWTGNGGELDGVSLKTIPAAGDAYELAEMPTTASMDVGGTSVNTTKYAYTNGMTMWFTDNEIVATFFGSGLDGKGLFKMEGEGFSNEITAVGTAAAAELKWE